MLPFAAMTDYVFADLFETGLAIDARPAPDPITARNDDTVCWICGAVSLDVHCKIICQNCGFMRDCSDP
jgi:hypothetical protein